MKFLRQAAGYSLFGHKRNGETLQEIKMDTVEEKLYI
jgi:hypothetical protein